jgi:16S rRNA (adenine1518-N6/adenine1519-N6)-dimethyltransferase
MENSEDNYTENTSRNFVAKKSLGQNFLHAPNVISAMVHAGKVSKENVVLEVGPGKGALTIKLLETGAHVVAVEKDDRAIPFLQEKFAGEIKTGQLELIHEDILKFETSKLKNYILIANIPYYITGEFMRRFLETDNQPVRIVVMVQKEVAKRITDLKESILSLSVKAYGEPKYLVTVPRKFFRPMPNVDSAVLVIENISKKFFVDSKIDEKYYFDIIKTAFAHKRKVVIKNLEEKIPKETLENIWGRENISRNARAEDLSPEMWKKIIGNT